MFRMPNKNFLAIETHGKYPKSTMTELLKLVDIQRQLILLYPEPYNYVFPESDDENLIYGTQNPVSGLILPLNTIDKFFENTEDKIELVMTGLYFGACHFKTFSRIVRYQNLSNKNINYHFILDLLQNTLRDISFSPDSFEYWEKLTQVTETNMFLDTKLVNPQSLSIERLTTPTDSNIYLWSSLKAFQEYAN
jgi:hypothetical protein